MKLRYSMVLAGGLALAASGAYAQGDGGNIGGGTRDSSGTATSPMGGGDSTVVGAMSVPTDTSSERTASKTGSDFNGGSTGSAASTEGNTSSYGTGSTSGTTGGDRSTGSSRPPSGTDTAPSGSGSR